MALSAAANIVLGALYVARAPGNSSPAGGRIAAMRAERARPGGDAKTQAAALPPGEMAEMSAEVVTALLQGDAVSLCDRLRSLGMPESVVRDVVRAMLMKPYNERRQQLLASKGAGNRAWWQGPDGGAETLTREERDELRAMTRDINTQLSAIMDAGDVSGRAASRYAFLPADKAARLAELDRDYGELRADLFQESRRFKVAGDDDALRLVREERDRDLAAILSPAEYEQYQKRYSPTASKLRQRVAGMDITESEYSAIYEVLAPLEKNSGENLSAKDRAVWQQASVDAIRSILGDERYGAYERSTNPDYLNLQAAAERFDIPSGTITQVYNLRDDVASQSQRIAADKSLSAKQKREALAALAANTRAEVGSQLGDEVAAAYLDKNMTWLRQVEKGGALQVTATGDIKIRAIPRDQPKNAKPANKNAKNPDKAKTAKNAQTAKPKK
ncbi:hypothetical protein AW736_24935 [Termitidicoccus mucosus]|uniref:Uncharacterized protein n=1 Tax=Termitidicoccus mucosus TaxID=1184151 RepID=A0A178IB08_9BACT|nr:hypothetical protein AW736_24935 [Opitutaceae bacterium TSB47]